MVLYHWPTTQVGEQRVICLGIDSAVVYHGSTSDSDVDRHPLNSQVREQRVVCLGIDSAVVYHGSTSDSDVVVLNRHPLNSQVRHCS